MHGPKAPSQNHGVYEYYASGTALTRLGQEWFQKASSNHPLKQKFSVKDFREVTGPMIGELALDGNQEAIRIIRQIGVNAGAGIVNVINLLNPEVITYGGGLTDLGDFLIRPMLQTIAERAIPTALKAVTIKKAALGNQAPLVGAAHLYRIDSQGNIHG
jgi:glucokinase